MEYQQIIAATERQFAEDERDIESRQAEMDAVPGAARPPAPGGSWHR